MKRFKLIMLIVFLFGNIMHGNAKGIEKDSLVTRYKMNEGWYIQAQSGINYMAAENTRFMSFGKVISPQAAISLGKYFTPVWGSRLQIVGGKDKGVYYAHDANSPQYSFRHYGVMGIGSFNITEFLNRKKNIFDQKQYNISALMGLGAIYTSFGYTEDVTGTHTLDYNNETYLSVFAGAEVSRKLSKKWELNLELSSNWMNNKYNGLTSVRNSKLKFDGIINMLIGVRYTFNCGRGKEKADVTTYREEPSLYIPHHSEPEIRENIRYEPKTDTTKHVVIYYSVEDLLDLVDNNESISEKQFGKTEFVNFDYGTCIIKPFNSIYLDKVAELMKKSNIVLLIRGFAVGKESVLDNPLTEQRINAVRDFLIKQGIDRARLVYQCIKASEILPEDKDKGQRVELEILSL